MITLGLSWSSRGVSSFRVGRWAIWISTFNTACSRAPGLKTSWWGWGGILPMTAADHTRDCRAALPLPAFSSSVKGVQL